MESSYSILQNERNRKNKRKSMWITSLLLFILIFLILMFIHTFYITPYQRRIAQQLKIEEKYNITFNGFNVDQVKFGNSSYSIRQGTQYHIYNHHIDLVYTVNQYDSEKLREALVKSKIDVASIKVGIGYEKPAIFVEDNNKVTYVFDYESYELIYYGELK